MKPGLFPLLALFCTLGLQPALAATPDNATELIARGTLLLQQGKLEPAQQAFVAALKADPRSVDAHMRLAGVNIAQNNFTAAIALYQQAIALDPNNAKAFIGMGIAYLHGGEKSLTHAAFEEAMRLEPGRRAQLVPILAKIDEATK